MKKHLFLFMVLVFSLLGQLGLQAENQTDELYTRRFAFLVGANNGGEDRVTLRYAVDDAEEIQKVLVEMGGILPGDSRFLADPDRETFFKEIKALAASVEQAKEKFRRVEVIFYYSGHSDEEHIFLGKDRVSYKEFRDLITSMEADVRIAILDSCASGSLTLLKGVTKRSPFLIDTAYDMKGYAFITSSSASEAAQESSRLKRSYFTHNLISGMRGAADMNQDRRITLNEAYQFAFDGTLTHTEKTAAGPQHPRYHIQMSGTGDVVITEIWKSTSVLVLKEDIAGKIYIHNQDNVLVVELKKNPGREISIGLDAGAYQIISISEDAVFESQITLESGKSQELGRGKFKQADKIPTRLRGIVSGSSLKPRMRRRGGRWKIEIFGGFSSIDPADLNLRAKFDDLHSAYYGEDYFQHLKEQGEIHSFVKTNEGGEARLLKHSIPVGFRIRYGITSWLDLSLGITYLSGTRNSSYKNHFEVVENGGSANIYSDEFLNYTLASKGYIPSIGIHLGKRIAPYLRLETYLTGGPLFAECRYSMNYITRWPVSFTEGALGDLDEGVLEEKGRGVGLSLQTGVRLNFEFATKYGLLVEGGYAFQEVTDISGPGIRSQASNRDSWEGEWGIKQDIRVMPWGTARFLWPSNAWTTFQGTWWRARDFKLDLSGFQLRIGIFYRF